VCYIKQLLLLATTGGRTEISNITGHVLPLTKEIKYLGIFTVQSRAFKCAIDDAKLYRAANAILAKSAGWHLRK